LIRGRTETIATTAAISNTTLNAKLIGFLVNMAAYSAGDGRHGRRDAVEPHRIPLLSKTGTELSLFVGESSNT
jgi:hypothetical protein